MALKQNIYLSPYACIASLPVPALIIRNELRMWPGLGHSGRLTIIHFEETWEGAKWAVDTQTDKKEF